jgi:hypothetical protein
MLLSKVIIPNCIEKPDSSMICLASWQMAMRLLGIQWMSSSKWLINNNQLLH